MVASSVLEAATAQPVAMELLQEPGIEPAEADVLLALERGWFDAAKRVMRERGAPVAAMSSVRAKAVIIRDQATEVINLMRTGANAEETVVVTAFQWAQRPDFLYLNVKFSSRIDGPVTCLNVDNEKITFGNEPNGNGTVGTLLFKGTGRQKPKLFHLNLTFFGAIVPEESSWSFASVGCMSITIAKATPHETWPRLLQSKAKPKNMHAWYDRQQTLDAEVKKEKEERQKAKDEAAKAEKAKLKPTPPTPTPPTPPTPHMPPMPPRATDGGATASSEAPAAPPRPTDSEPTPPPADKPPPAGKKKGGKKGEGSKKKAKKDEL